MTWTIAGQVGTHTRPGYDASGWYWEIRRGDEARCVLVEVTGTASAIHDRGGSLPDETSRAVESEGLSEVERVLGEADPPRVIQCGTNGCHAEAATGD
ncbi:MAG: hypothetical protein ACXW0R_08835 [Gaiellaceae bacterium]